MHHHSYFFLSLCAVFCVKKRKLSVSEIGRPLALIQDAFPGPFGRAWTPCPQTFAGVKLTHIPAEFLFLGGQRRL
jgi:hypothetical protein